MYLEQSEMGRHRHPCLIVAQDVCPKDRTMPGYLLQSLLLVPSCRGLFFPLWNSEKSDGGQILLWPHNIVTLCFIRFGHRDELLLRHSRQTRNQSQTDKGTF